MLSPEVSLSAIPQCKADVASEDGEERPEQNHQLSTQPDRADQREEETNVQGSGV